MLDRGGGLRGGWWRSGPPRLCDRNRGGPHRSGHGIGRELQDPSAWTPRGPESAFGAGCWTSVVVMSARSTGPGRAGFPALLVLLGVLAVPTGTSREEGEKRTLLALGPTSEPPGERGAGPSARRAPDLLAHRSPLRGRFPPLARAAAALGRAARERPLSSSASGSSTAMATLSPWPSIPRRVVMNSRSPSVRRSLFISRAGPMASKAYAVAREIGKSVAPGTTAPHDRKVFPRVSPASSRSSTPPCS